MEATVNERKPAELFPPGEYIKDELEARGWTQADLAEIMGRSPNDIVNLISGKRAISTGIAIELSAAFGTGADVWMNLENSYRLWLAAAPADAIKRRARLREIAPYKEMARRNWIELSEDIGVLERRIMDYFGMAGINTPVAAPFLARKATMDFSSLQLAWAYRAKHLAPTVPAGHFSQRSLEEALDSLRELLLSAPSVRRIPRILADAGIRFLIVEPLAKSKIDGATFWLDKKSPVIALSFRYDRFDYFWYTLCHELGHVRRGDDGHLDEAMFGEGQSESDDPREKEANAFAQAFLVDQRALNDFVARKGPLYSGEQIRNFAHLQQIHPGLVVGQLQHRGEVPWTHFHGMLEKVRDYIIPSALTDGWGHVVPALS